MCDFQELYRYLADDFLIQCCQKLRRKNFIVKNEGVSKKRKKGKREYLNDLQTRDFLKRLYRYFEFTVVIPRIRVGRFENEFV